MVGFYVEPFTVKHKFANGQYWDGEDIRTAPPLRYPPHAHTHTHTVSVSQRAHAEAPPNDRPPPPPVSAARATSRAPWSSSPSARSRR